MPSLEFTLMVGCPLMCTFCPQDKLRGMYGKATKYFTLENFKEIVRKVPKHVRIDFSGMAEPWANPDATEMLRHVLTEGYRFALYTTLYGMERTDCAQVIDLLRRHAPQVEVVCLHLPDRNGNMRGWKYNADYEANLIDFIRLAMQRVMPSFEVMTMDEGGTPHKDLDHLGIKLGPWIGHTRAGNVSLEDVPGQKIYVKPEHNSAVSCSFTRFYDQNVCLPNGDVVLCCMDYGMQHKIGNLLEQDYYEMFASSGIAKLMVENMRPRFSHESLCKTCNRATLHGQPNSYLRWQPV
ncbi:MAG TPA: radical SAM protein [Acetobacteraceae bacterium]|nr:radical SAM protein [Acetobacteraceae bacterium]